MSELERKKPLSTADLAAASGPPAPAKGSGPIHARREYEEKPAGEKITAEMPRPPRDAKPAAAAAAPATPREVEEDRPALFSADETRRFREEWQAIQIAFVDEPRGSVEKADALVAGVIQRLASSFSDEKARLEGQWDRGEDVSTEDLRVNLRRYRTFFDRLLNV